MSRLKEAEIEFDKAERELAVEFAEMKEVREKAYIPYHAARKKAFDAKQNLIAAQLEADAMLPKMTVQLHGIVGILQLAIQQINDDGVLVTRARNWLGLPETRYFNFAIVNGEVVDVDGNLDVVSIPGDIVELMKRRVEK